MFSFNFAWLITLNYSVNRFVVVVHAGSNTLSFVEDWFVEIIYTVSQKNCTPKTGRHKFCYFPNTIKSEIYVL